MVHAAGQGLLISLQHDELAELNNHEVIVAVQHMFQHLFYRVSWIECSLGA